MNAHSLPQSVSLRPIAVVHNDIAAGREVRWEEIVSRIEVDPALLPALEGIEEFSHLIVVFVFHQREAGPQPLQVHPERRPDMPLVGVLATRSPQRPNPIGIGAVELLGREGNVLTVRGLDAFDGSPVLDIKPYLPRGDRIGAVRVPAWIERLWAEQQEKG